MSTSAVRLVYNPLDLLRSCMLNPIDNDMPLLASLFASSKSTPPTPKPAGKRRASPLKDSPIPSDDDDDDDDDDESPASDYVMGEIKHEKKPKSDRPEEEDIPMEQADYDRGSDSDEDKKSSDPPLEERPRQKAMPMQPPVPTLRLTPKIKAQPSTTGRRDGVRQYASIEQSKWVSPNKPEQIAIKLPKDSSNPLPFWNHKPTEHSTTFLSICEGPMRSHVG